MKTLMLIAVFALGLLTAACAEEKPEPVEAVVRTGLPQQLNNLALDEYLEGLVFWKKEDCSLDKMPVYLLQSVNNPIAYNNHGKNPSRVFDLTIMISKNKKFNYFYVEREISFDESLNEVSVEVYRDDGEGLIERSGDNQARLGKWGFLMAHTYRRDVIGVDVDLKEREHIFGQILMLELTKSNQTIDPAIKNQICN